MQREARLPQEFAHLNVQYVQKKNRTEYSSTCPECGGVPHQSGEWPDRFVMFLDANPRGWCRKCGVVVWPDGEARKLSKEEQLIRKEIEEQVLKDQRARIDKKLAQIREDKAWLRWHIEMDAWGKQQWYNRGIPDEFQDFWKLGLRPEYTTSSGFVTPSLSIPCFDKEWNITQIYHRLLKVPPPPEGGKYRQTADLRPALFIADPDYFLNEQVIIAEGQIKAQVGFKALLGHELDNMQSIVHNGLNMVAIPSKEPNMDIFKPIKDAKRVYLVLDPDAREPNKTGRVAQTELIHKMKQQYDFEIYTIDLYDKLDDMILRLGLGDTWWAGRLRRAVMV